MAAKNKPRIDAKVLFDKTEKIIGLEGVLSQAEENHQSLDSQAVWMDGSNIAEQEDQSSTSVSSAKKELTTAYTDLVRYLQDNSVAMKIKSILINEAPEEDHKDVQSDPLDIGYKAGFYIEGIEDLEEIKREQYILRLFRTLDAIANSGVDVDNRLGYGKIKVPWRSLTVTFGVTHGYNYKTHIIAEGNCARVSEVHHERETTLIPISTYNSAMHNLYYLKKELLENEVTLDLEYKCENLNKIMDDI